MTKAIVLPEGESVLDGKAHVGIAVHLESSGNPSTLVISDVSNIDKNAPVFITKPIKLDFENLKKFLVNKKVITDDALLGRLLDGAEVSVEAFYYTKEGPCLMKIKICDKNGLIKTLTDDDDLANLFNVEGASVQYMRCSDTEFETLKNYVASLSEA